jgi:phospholipid-transporting ATPase
LLVLVFQLSICLAFAIASWAWRQTQGYDHYYLAMDVYTSGNYQNAFVYIIILFITFWILFSYLVPISLFVTIEIVKFVLVRTMPLLYTYHQNHQDAAD